MDQISKKYKRLLLEKFLLSPFPQVVGSTGNQCCSFFKKTVSFWSYFNKHVQSNTFITHPHFPTEAVAHYSVCFLIILFLMPV